MASQLFTPGPQFIFTGTGSAGAYEFLGYTESEVMLSLSGAYEDVFADYGGPRVPVDAQYMNEQASVSMTLLRYDEAVYNHCAARIVGGTAGTAGTNSIGSLMGAQSLAYKLFVYAPYSTETFFSTMNKGYVFGFAWLTDNIDIPLGVRVKRPRLTFRCLPNWTVSTLSSVTYSNVLPSPLPTPT